MALLQKGGIRRNSPFSLRSSHADDLGGAERVEAVDEGDADVDFSRLSAQR